MKRLPWLWGWVILGCGLYSTDAEASTPEPPNIVFILADDLGARDLSNEGSTFYESPNIDRIARMGMRFTRGYATCQVCSPSRASILTGRYPVNTGITTWIGDASGEVGHSGASGGMVDTRDLKSLGPRPVRVRIPPRPRIQESPSP